MKLIYFHLPKILPYMKPVYDSAYSVSESLGIELIDHITPKEDENAMHDGLESIWGTDDILKIDQDNLLTVPLAESFLNCGYDLCISPTVIYPKYSGIEKEMSNCQEYHDNMRDKKLLPVGFKQEFVTFGGGGMIKFSKSWQNKIDLPEFAWIQSDTKFHNMALETDTKFHVHQWHDHTKDNLDYEIYQ